MAPESLVRIAAPPPPPTPDFGPAIAAAVERQAKLRDGATDAAYRAVASVLAVRVQLLLSLIGAFVLALFAMQWQSPAGLYVLIAFCALTILPLVALHFLGRPR